MTAPRDVADALRQSEERQSFLLALSDALRPLTSATDIKNAACTRLGRHLRASRVNFFDIVGDEFVAEVGYTDGVAPLTRGVVSEFGEVWRSDYRDNELMVSHDIANDERFSPSARASFLAVDVAAFIVVMLMRDGRWLADLAVHHREPRRWTADEVALAREVAVRIRDAAERGQAELALRDSEARYRTLFATMTQGYGLFELVRDARGEPVDYRILEVNPAFERHVGMPAAEAIGRTAYEIWPDLDPSWLATYVRMFADGRPIRFENNNGMIGRWYDCHAYPRGGDRFVLLYEEISERKRREQARALLAAIADDLVRLDDIAATMQRLGERIAHHFGVKHCVFTEHASGMLIATYAWQAADVSSLAGTYRASDYLGPVAMAAILAGEPVVVDETRTDPRVDADAYGALGIRSFVIVPLVRDQRWQFQISVIDTRPRVWLDEEVDLLREAIDRIWARLERALAEAALRASEAHLAGQNAAFQAAVQGAPLEVSLGVLVRTAVAQADPGTRCAFYLADPTGTELRHVVGMPDTYARIADQVHIGPDAPTCGLALYSNSTVVTADINTDPLWAPWRDVAAAHGFRACWSFPLETASGKMVGTFAIYHREPREPTPREIEAAAVMTRAAALIVSRHQEADERARAEAARRAAEEQLRLALAAARMGTWTWDRATDRHTRDANLNVLLGLPAAVSVQPLQDMLDRIHPEDRDNVARTFDRSARDGRPMSVEFRVLQPSGAVRWLRDQGDVFGTAGQARLLGACVDVTDLKEAEAALRRANDELEVRVVERTAELAAALDSLEGEMARRRDLARRLGKAQEDERQRVARDLHDSIGQLMAGLSMAFKSVENAGVLPPPVAGKLAAAQAISAALAKEVHALAVRLRPTSLDDIGLEAALSQLVAEWSERVGVDASFHAAGVETHRLPPAVETTIYRVVQEALTNVARHARATSAGVIVRRMDGHVSVVVEDDGVGFDPAAATDRLGLMGMRERVDLVGGELEVEASPGAGTTIVVTIPIAGEGAA